MLDPAVASRLLADDRRLVIIGAGGWLGLATLENLVAALGDAFDHRVVCVGSTRRSLRLRDERKIAQIALDDLHTLERRPTWVLHFAFLTKDRAEQMSEAEYRAANGRIGEAVMAALDPIGAEAIFVASSGAAYRAGDPAASAAMRLYGELKQEDEIRFERWAQEPGRRAVIARIFNVTGPYINKHQAYALASFILDGLAGRRIEVRAPRRVVRAYVAISEVMSLVFAELGAATSGTSRFDTGGQPLELGEVAGVVAAQFPRVEVDRAPIVELQDDIYHGDVAAYARLLVHHGIAATPLETQVAKTIDYLREDQ
jgi:nucleoside-diphosphate-sugar epimerase